MNNRDDFNIDIDLRRKKRKRVKKRYTVKLLKRINVIVCALTFYGYCGLSYSFKTSRGF